MYYKSLIEHLKEEDKDNRLEIIETKSDAKTCLIKVKLHPKDIYICPRCGGNEFVFLAIARANEFKQKIMNQIDEYEDYKVKKQAQALADAIKN